MGLPAKLSAGVAEGRRLFGDFSSEVTGDGSRLSTHCAEYAWGVRGDKDGLETAFGEGMSGVCALTVSSGYAMLRG
ncbi:hypothetical protein [Granulicella sp. S190]|uniref:hypothetical protein n=1 Tax=Granulicella sp. S190 TaxID=1747226 RepID=UPI00131CA2FA|nr:hypothetical protein [Granulicella sp. S190]